MAWSHVPQKWENFTQEILIYLLIGGCVHLFIIIISMIIMILAKYFFKCGIRYSIFFRFHVILFICSMLAHYIWSCSIWGKFYWSVDYMVDYFPFFPIRKSVIDYSWGEGCEGKLNDISLLELNLIWSLFTFLVLCFTFYFNWLLKRKK